ncbi:hypothetical protein ACWGJ9_08750 [Curtobacterium citreum]
MPLPTRTLTWTHRTLRRDRAATDPILVIAAIAVSLVLLVGGSFAVAGMINNSKDLNAKNDLDRIATAQAAVQSSGGTYLAFYADQNGTVDASNSSKDSNGKYLNQSTVGFTLSGAVDVVNSTNAGNSPDGKNWFAAEKSASGKYFVRTSTSSKTLEVSRSDLENNYSLLDVTGSYFADAAVY